MKIIATCAMTMIFLSAGAFAGNSHHPSPTPGINTTVIGETQPAAAMWQTVCHRGKPVGCSAI